MKLAVNRILVTGVGGGVGQSIVKSLQGTPYEIVGVDAEVLGTGLYAVPKSYVVPYASSSGYVQRLLEICKDEDCRMIFPGLDAELPVLSEYAQEFHEIGASPIVSSQQVVQICDDKLLTYEFLAGHGFYAPRTFPLTQDIGNSLSFPFVIKPRKGGARSKGVFLVRDPRELDYRISNCDTDNYVAQEFIDGNEYTCGSVNLDGHCYGAIVMKRVLRDGDTYKAFVEKNPPIETYVVRVAEELKPFGACNFQLRMRDGRPYILEINARCSGTTYSRTLAGFNEPLMIASYLTTGVKPSYEIQEITILRYWKELVVENQRIECIQQKGMLEGNKLEL